MNYSTFVTGSNQPISERPDLSVDQILALNPQDIVKVYSGEDGKCACGCAGIYAYNPIHKEYAEQDRGYALTSFDLNVMQIEPILRIVQEFIKFTSVPRCIGWNFASVSLNGWMYAIYVREGN